MMKYPNYQPLIDPAQPTSGLGRLIMGSAMTIIGYFALGVFYYAIIARLDPAMNWAQVSAEIASGSTPYGVLYLLGSFLMMIAALWVPLRLVHRRGLLGLFGPLRLVTRDFLRVSGAIAVLYICVSLIPMPAKFMPTPNLDAAIWRAVLPLAVFAIFIQVTAEELVFRGYLQSQLAARFRSPWIWIALPSVLFGMLHYDPVGAGENARMVVFTAILFGLIAADLTARSGNLGAAMGVHFVTNITAILLAAPAEGLNGLALYTYPFTMDDAVAASYWMPIDIMLLITGWLAARLMIKR